MFSFSKLLKTKNKQIHIGQKKMNKKISFPQLKKTYQILLKFNIQTSTNYSKSLNELPWTLGEFNIQCL